MSVKTSAPTNVHEQEANRVADQVTGDRERRGSDPDIRPLTTDVDKAALPNDTVDGIRVCGNPLEPAVRDEMEQRFNHDFSRVRVHSGADAERSARSVAADAYTLGHDIVFGPGKYRPQTVTGRRLIAHELTHVVQSGATRGTMSRSAVLLRQPEEAHPSPAPDTDPCTVEDPQLPVYDAAERKQRHAVLKDMLRGTTTDEQRAWCKPIRRAMVAFSVGQLQAMKRAGVRFWKPGEFPPPFKGEYAPKPPSGTELARYQPETRVIQRGPKAGVDEIRHELAHAWDHVRGGKVARLDNVRGRALKKAVMAPTTFSSETSAKRLTIEESVGDAPTKVRLSLPEMFQRFMSRPVRAGAALSFANVRTDPDHVLSNVKEFFAEGYSVFHGDYEDAQALLLCDAPELYQMLEDEAKKAGLPIPDRSKLLKNNADNGRTCG